MRSRVELFEAIRRDARRDELSIRALAERHGVHRRTVREALRSAVPAPRKPRTAQAPKLDPVRSVIDEILRVDLNAPRKQRHTARRIHERLPAEHGVVGLSYSAVRDYVRRRRPEIAAAAGRARPAAFILQGAPFAGRALPPPGRTPARSRTNEILNSACRTGRLSDRSHARSRRGCARRTGYVGGGRLRRRGGPVGTPWHPLAPLGTGWHLAAVSGAKLWRECCWKRKVGLGGMFVLVEDAAEADASVDVQVGNPARIGDRFG